MSRHTTPPPQQPLPALAQRKRNAAAKREAQAVILREEAAELDARWARFKRQEIAGAQLDEIARNRESVAS